MFSDSTKKFSENINRAKAFSENIKSLGEKLNNKIDLADATFSEAQKFSENINETQKAFSENIKSLDEKVTKADSNISSSVEKMENKIQVAARKSIYLQT